MAYAGRPVSASTAVGYMSKHVERQQQLVADAFAPDLSEGEMLVGVGLLAWYNSSGAWNDTEPAAAQDSDYVVFQSSQGTGSGSGTHELLPYQR